MKEEHTKAELIQYRIGKAKKTLNSAKLMLQGESDGSSVANRLYYVCFYCVIALLAQKDIDYKSHKSVKTALSHLFIKN